MLLWLGTAHSVHFSLFDCKLSEESLLGKCLVTLGSSHYMSVVPPVTVTATKHISECLWVGGSHPHSKTGRSRDRVLFIFVSSVTGTLQAINKCLLNWQMNDSVSIANTERSSSIPKIHSLKTLCIEFSCHVRQELSTWNELWQNRESLSEWVLEENGKGRWLNKWYGGAATATWSLTETRNAELWGMKCLPESVMVQLRPEGWVGRVSGPRQSELYGKRDSDLCSFRERGRRWCFRDRGKPSWEAAAELQQWE